MKMKISVKLALLMAVVSSDLIRNTVAGLYPQESESRIIVDLAGIWNFRVSTDPDQGFNEKWYMQPLSEVTLSYPDTCLCFHVSTDWSSY